jgi:hypothetical protein
MLAQLMSFQINFRLEHNEFLLQTLRIRTQKMVLPEMQLQLLIIEVILRPAVIPVADEAPLMCLSTVHVKLVLTVESPPAKSTLRMSLKPALVDCSWIIISFPHMSIQLFIRE